jgi:SAM-dependent methyltransferase
MLVQPFKTTQFNEHCEGIYESDREIEWRRIGAIDKVSNIQSLLRTEKVQSILEVGCGTGAVLAALAKRGIGTSHSGIDLTAPGKHADSGAKDLSLSAYDGQTIPFPDGSVDFVYASHVVEHVLNPRGFIMEISRVAKRLVYLEVPCELHARTRHSDMQKTLNIGHINSYSPESFSLLCQSAGLRILDSTLFDHSLEIHKFNSSPAKAIVKMGIRRALLSAHPIFASRIFTYHFGVLGSPSRN